MPKKSPPEMVERGAQQRAAVNARWAKPGQREAQSLKMQRLWALARQANDEPRKRKAPIKPS
jgi:hypothetical protein